MSSFARIYFWCLAQIVKGSEQRRLFSTRFIIGTCCFCLWITPVAVQAADTVSDAQALMRVGKYDEAAAILEASQESWNRNIQFLRVKKMMITGPWDEAAAQALLLPRRFFRSIEGLMLAHDAAEQIGRADITTALLERIHDINSQVSLDGWDAADLVALGRAALVMGEEPKRVLTQFFNRAKKLDPSYLPAYFAAGELAFSKNDIALATQQYTEAAKHDPDNPDIHFGFARCAKASDRVKMLQHIEAALAINPNHIGCLLLQAEHEIDREAYEKALATLQRVEAVNSVLPELWCYRAVVAHLTGDETKQQAYRTKALEPWPTNPMVDHLIGRKLSEKYRFAEGAEHQRRALAFSPNKMPATIQLAQDLLRLGKEKEGWELAEQVAEKDGYNVIAHNLSELRHHMKNFTVIENDDFIVRMDGKEAQVYGQEVMDLLAASKKVLCEKYGLQLSEKITVEIFAEEQDFAIRTFGVPGSAGYLGVCFGKVITMNSPAGLAGGTSNWRAVLWHEFCHVVTLHMTKNKMPRWLSEGISVYEELQRDPSWGQCMTPTYRRMVLDGALSPIGDMSGAFMNPKSGTDLLFAYYESALAVEFIINKFGLNSLRAILTDLGAGKNINVAIETHTAPMSTLEAEFKSFVHARAVDGIESLDVLAVPEEELAKEGNPALLSAWANEHPKSYWGRRYLGDVAAEENKWQQARQYYEQAVALDVHFAGHDSAYGPLARACGELGDKAAQRAIWTTWAQLSPTAVPAFEGLITLAVEENAWDTVAQLTKRVLDVNPMLEGPRRFQARAAETKNQTADAVVAYQKLLALKPLDSADVNYRLAKLLKTTDPQHAKRYVLNALADAPRFRAAHAVLLELTSQVIDP